MSQKKLYTFLSCAAAMAALADPYDIPTKRKCKDTNAHRKARKERARMLTRKREEELKTQALSQKIPL